MNTRQHLVYCPRQTPTCLVTSGVLDSIGHTPLIKLKSASSLTGCTILAKAEFMNPGGSVKDRIAKYMIEKAEQDAMDEQRELCNKNRERIEGAARGVSRERIRAGLERVIQEAEQSSQEFDAEGETIAESIETTDQEVLEQEQRAADLVQNPPEF